MDQITAGGFVPPRFQIWPRDSFRVVDWNIDRGTHLDSILEFLKSCKADLIFLQEVDLNAKRTRHLDIAQEIARALQLNFVFGREFEELTQGSRKSPAYQGQATLSPWPIRNARVIRFQRQTNFWEPHWYLPRMEPFQERRGGRIALVAEVEISGHTVTTYNLHLESKEDDGLRVAQLNQAVTDFASCRNKWPAVLAGDLNLNAGEGRAAAVLHDAGFQDAVGLPNVRTRPARGMFDEGRYIDWIFCAGNVRSRDGQVHSRIRASDHFPVSFTLAFA